MVGGSSNLMSGFFYRLKPEDFRLLSEFGPIQGANVADWPITYEDLEPYYTMVESTVGVSGRVTDHPFAEPRSSREFPFAPHWSILCPASSMMPVVRWVFIRCQLRERFYRNPGVSDAVVSIPGFVAVMAVQQVPRAVQG